MWVETRPTHGSHGCDCSRGWPGRQSGLRWVRICRRAASLAQVHFTVWVRAPGSGQALPRMIYEGLRILPREVLCSLDPRASCFKKTENVAGNWDLVKQSLKGKQLHSRKSFLFVKGSWVSFQVLSYLRLVSGLLCDLGQAALTLCPQLRRVLKGPWRLCQHPHSDLIHHPPPSLLHHSSP